jgi:hypothetical protein
MAFGGSLAGTARVVLGVDTRDFNRDLTQAEGRFRTSTRNMDRDVGQLSRGVAAGSGAFRGFARSVAFASASFLGAAGFTALLRQSVTAASDLDEAINATKVTFRDAAPAMLEWSETAAEALGMSQRAALQNASSIGAMLIPMGFARTEAGAMSRELVQLATDMASLHNQDPTEMLDRIRSGLAGESEPLRRFGVDLRETAVQAFALREGLVKKGESLTAAGQLVARYRVLLEQTKTAQGDFANTAGSAANAQRTLRGTIEDAQAALGRAFLPTVERLLPRLTEWADELAANEELHERVADAVETTADTIANLATAADDAVDAIGGWDDAFKLVLAGTLASGFAKLLGVAGAGAMGAQGASGLAGMARILGRLRALGTIYVAIEIATNWEEIKREIREEAGNPDWWKEIFSRGAFKPIGAAAKGIQDEIFRDGSPLNPAGRQTFPFSSMRGIRRGGGAKEHGTRAIGNWWSDNAIDLMGPAWAAVYAVEDGLIGAVTLRPTNGRGVSDGATVFLHGNSGTSYAYMHLEGSTVTVRQGMRVKAGTFIGRIGPRTAGGPHLHLGVNRGDPARVYDFPVGRVSSGSSSQSGRGRQDEARTRSPLVPPSGSDPDPTADDKNRNRRTPPLIPFRLQERLLRAEETKSLADDLKVLQEIDRFLTAKIAKERDIEKRIALRNERQGVRREIADITKAKPKKKNEAEDPILQGLYLREAQAADTRRLDDDLKALEAIDAYLTKRIAKEKDVEKKTALIRERQGVRGRIRDVEEQMPIKLPGFTRPPAPIAGLAGVLGAAERLRGGQQVVTLPGLGQILVGNLEPTRQMWSTLVDQLKKKLAAAIQRRKTLERSLQRAKRLTVKRVREAAVERVLNNLQAARAQEKELRDALGLALTAIGDIDETTAAKEQQEADEAERKRQDEEKDAERAARDAEAFRFREGFSYLNARADVAATNAGNIFGAGYAPPVLPISAPVADALLASFGSSPALATSAASLDAAVAASGGSSGPANVTVVQNFTSQPEDPFAYMRAAHFATMGAFHYPE